MSSNLIYCGQCRTVLYNNFAEISTQDNEEQRKFADSSQALDKKLLERKYEIHSYYADIEQTKWCFKKYCFVCEKVEYFNEVEE